MTDENGRKLFVMPQMDRVSVRLTKAQVGYVRAIAERLHIEQSDVIRLAITRLAQWEGVVPMPPVMEFLRELILHEHEKPPDKG